MRRNSSRILPEDELAQPFLPHESSVQDIFNKNHRTVPKKQKIQQTSDVGARVRQIDKFWVEKLSLIHECFQIYALFWVAGVSWPMPLSWQRFTCITLLSNLDVVTFWHFVDSPAKYRTMVTRTLDESLMPRGHMDICTLASAVAWVIVITVPTIVFRRVQTKHRKQVRPWNGTLKKAKWESRLHSLWWFSYLPATLALFRLLSPSPDYAWGVPGCNTVSYFGELHVAIVAICAPPLVVFILGVPYRYFKRIQQIIVYDSSIKHERYIQRRELEYCLNLSTEYKLSHMDLVASFTRQQVFWPFWSCVRKVTFVALVVTCEKYSYIVGSGILAVSLLIYTRNSFSRRFRCQSTQLMFMGTETCLLYNIFLGCLKANRIQSAIAVDSVLIQWLVAMNLLITISFLAYILLLIKRRSNYNSIADRWPTTLQEAELFTGKDSSRTLWLPTILEARELIDAASHTPAQLWPSHRIEKLAFRVSNVWREAKDDGSLLADTFENILEEMQAGLHDHEKVSAMQSEEAEILLSHLAKRVTIRDRETILMRPSKKAILFKLFVLKTWMGDRNIKPLQRLSIGGQNEAIFENIRNQTLIREWEVASMAEVQVAVANLIRMYESIIATGKELCSTCDRAIAENTSMSTVQLGELERVRETMKREITELTSRPNWDASLMSPSKEQLLGELVLVVKALGDRLVSAFMS